MLCNGNLWAHGEQCGRVWAPADPGRPRPAGADDAGAPVRKSDFVQSLDRGLAVVYVVRVPTKRIMTVAISVGTRFPAYATSMGRMLLAAMSEEELDRYLADVVLEPFTSRTVTDPGRLREIVNVSAHASRVSMTTLRSAILPELPKTARQIEADLQAPGSA
jgi:IclR family pca regulon transcriptional regulator